MNFAKSISLLTTFILILVLFPTQGKAGGHSAAAAAREAATVIQNVHPILIGAPGNSNAPRNRVVLLPDGLSVLVENPSYTLNGKDYPIGTGYESGSKSKGSGTRFDSSVDGICKHLGYEHAVGASENIQSKKSGNVKRVAKNHNKHTVTTFESDITVARISSDGDFNGTYAGSEPDAELETFTVVPCSLKKNVPTSFGKENYEQLIPQMSTGNVTIIQPNFGVVDGKKIGISLKSDLNALCRVYGFTNHVPGSESYRLNEDNGFDKRFSAVLGFAGELRDLSINKGNGSCLATITCSRK